MRLLLAVCAALMIAPAAAHGAAFLPPGNKVFWGGIGGYEKSNIRDFKNQSGKHPAVYGFFVKMKAGRSDLHWLGFRFEYANSLIVASSAGRSSMTVGHGSALRCTRALIVAGALAEARNDSV